MSSDDFYKKHLQESDTPANAGAKRVLEVLRKNPEVMNRVEPPPGYETELLASLRRQLPLHNKQVAKKPKSSRFKWLTMPAFAWSLSGAFALVAMMSVMNFHPEITGGSQSDLLAQTARKGGADMVGNWMASMGDTTLQRRVAMADIDSAARDLAQSKDRKVVEQVLSDVARKMGMK